MRTESGVCVSGGGWCGSAKKHEQKPVKLSVKDSANIYDARAACHIGRDDSSGNRWSTFANGLSSRGERSRKRRVRDRGASRKRDAHIREHYHRVQIAPRVLLDPAVGRLHYDRLGCGDTTRCAGHTQSLQNRSSRTLD
eukprot:4750086-Prymnesium_polylepis.1